VGLDLDNGVLLHLVERAVGHVASLVAPLLDGHLWAAEPLDHYARGERLGDAAAAAHLGDVRRLQSPAWMWRVAR